MYNFGGSLTLTNTGFCHNTPDQIAGDPITDGGGNSLLYCAPPIPKPTGPTAPFGQRARRGGRRRE